MILVTGVTGFIGKHLLGSLIEKFGKSNVLALTSEPTSACSYLLHNQYHFDAGLFDNAGITAIDTVIHAGAFIPKKAADANDPELCHSNIENTFRLITSLPKTVKKFIFFSTVDVYNTTDTINEQTPVNPASLYGHSKLYCEKMLEAWADKNTITLQILRIGHVYGPGEEKYRKMIPVTINRLLNNQAPQRFGAGVELRSFIYVQDVVDSIICSMELEKYNGPVNIVSEQAISIKEVIQKLTDISGIRIEPEIIPTNQPGRDLVFDTGLMKKLLRKETVRLDEGLLMEWNYAKSINTKQA